MGKSRIRTAEDPKATPVTTEARLTTSVLSLIVSQIYGDFKKPQNFLQKNFEPKRKFFQEFLKGL